MTYLLDTDTLVFMVRGLRISAPKDDRQRERLEMAKRIEMRCRRHHLAGDVIGLSAITVAELEYGARRSGFYAEESALLRQALAPFATFDFDATLCAEHYGAVRQVLESAGTAVGAMDLLIAGHAKALGATVVTNNADHFSRVPDLRYENWTA
jgi:tRNA(fMet)-specific endonuclease VapC